MPKGKGDTIKNTSHKTRSEQVRERERIVRVIVQWKIGSEGEILRRGLKGFGINLRGV